jgi:hypothetical protein
VIESHRSFFDDERNMVRFVILKASCWAEKDGRSKDQLGGYYNRLIREVTSLIG